MINSSLKILFFAVVILGSTFTQIYWSMGEFSGQVSGSCFECSFVKDIFFISCVATLFLTPLLFAAKMIKNRPFKIAVEFLLIIFVWLLCDNLVFADRYTNWSTFSFGEEIYYMLPLSILPILVLSSIVLFVINRGKN